jgi:hypothetical protein
MAGVRMTSLRRAPNGDWFSRKLIPEDIREAYKQTFGVSQEARFRCPASTREWVAKLGCRGHGPHRAAAGTDQRGGATDADPAPSPLPPAQWYTWFTGQHEDNAGDPEDWALTAEPYEAARTSASGLRDERDQDPRDETPRGPRLRAVSTTPCAPPAASPHSWTSRA